MSALDTDVVSTLYNVENLTLIFVSFWTSDQRYFHVDPQLWSDVEILDGRGLLEYSKQIFSKVVDDSLSKIIIQVFFCKICCNDGLLYLVYIFVCHYVFLLLLLPYLFPLKMTNVITVIN